LFFRQDSKKCKKTDDLLPLAEGLGGHGLAQAEIWITYVALPRNRDEALG